MMAEWLSSASDWRMHTLTKNLHPGTARSRQNDQYIHDAGASTSMTVHICMIVTILAMRAVPGADLIACCKISNEWVVCCCVQRGVHVADTVENCDRHRKAQHAVYCHADHDRFWNNHGSVPDSFTYRVDHQHMVRFRWKQLQATNKLGLPKFVSYQMQRSNLPVVEKAENEVSLHKLGSNMAGNV